ncbi:DsbA family protein [Streptomyces pathocidini]|uniref:DsbA family protein n=1 Tax=Streptomyces pathocidini TaxID=1650571 RepID=A0ABW7UVJ4_9ACTN|nr:thioredoxin domain-containing protein [Streptomyces pathocidini]
MSDNNREGKRSARERLREERRREQTREKRKRSLLVGVAAVAVLALAGGIGVAVTQLGGKDGDGPVVAPTGANGEDSLAIPVGRAGAPSTLTVYEDFRCPACAQFEHGFRDTIRELEDKGRLRTQYHLVTIIDGNMGGSGSLNAANAAACAQDARKFRDYHDVLYRNQPQEQDDAFADKKRLIKLAGQVKGLDTAGFRACVNEGSHDGWVRKATTAFNGSGHQGTPTVLLNGKNVYADQQNPLTPDKLRKRVEDAAKKA